MNTIVPYDPILATYDLGSTHPLKPERFTLAVSLMREYGILDDGEQDPGSRDSVPATVVDPDTLTRSDLELVHDPGYIDTVIEASENPGSFHPRSGLGAGDTPAFGGVHEASLMVCGATSRAVRSVLRGEARRAFAPAGGLHHAHRDHAAGFCVYNDPAVAIALARERDPGLRVAYIDIDAHHGDGVEEAFWDEPDVLTISVHESGRYLFPGTGRATDTGGPAARGSALNVPLPPYSNDACYLTVSSLVVAPAIEAFAPDLIFLQCGADAHRDDPLTHLGLTLVGYRDLIASIVRMAETYCEGRIVASGGGGYGTYSVVPRAWTLALAELMGVELPETLPEEWRAQSSAASGMEAPRHLTEEAHWESPFSDEEIATEVAIVISAVRDASPLLKE